MTETVIDAKPLPDVVTSIVINAPVQKVWDEITKTGSVQLALYNTVLDTDLVPGSKLRYYSTDRKRVFVVGKVLEVEPPTRFVHTYIFCLNPGPETTVTWELEEVEGGCKVNLTHTGWTTAHQKVEKQAAGWNEILGLLKDVVEVGNVSFGMRVMYWMMGMLKFTLPKTTKVEEADRRGW